MDLTSSKSLAVLQETPIRSLKMLTAIASVPAIRAAMSTRGYMDAEQDEGFALMLKASGYKRTAALPNSDPKVRAALVEIDAWDETNFRIARAALARKHQPQCDFVFNGLEASSGVESLAGVALFCERVDALENSPERKATRREDKAALETLAARGITPEERARVKELIKIASSAPAVDPEPAKTRADAEAERLQALRELRAWYDEWSEVARAVVKRRDHLIQMGLAKRKGEKKTETLANPDVRKDDRYA